MRLIALFVVLLLTSTVLAQDNKIEPIELQPPPVFVRYYYLKMDDGTTKRVSFIWSPTWDEVKRGAKFEGASAWPWTFPIPKLVPRYNPAFPNRRYYNPVKTTWKPGKYSAFDTEVAKGPPYEMKAGDKNPFELYSPEWRKWNYQYINTYYGPVGGQ